MGLIASSIVQNEDIQSEYVSLLMSRKNEYIHLQVQPPKDGPRLHTDIICVLDTSGSMSTEATVKNSEGIKESQGYSLLDILKHAVKTTIYNLNQDDRFALVNFESVGRVQYKLNLMTDHNKEAANQILQKLQASGSTNLWDGLLKGLELLRSNQTQNRQQVIILLTDGEPTDTPSGGYNSCLQNYINKYSTLLFTLHTLALGKQMDSDLLDSLATTGKGQFSFIPCSGFMGTIFVNTFSNILCSCANNAYITLRSKCNTKINEIIGYENKEIIHLGDLKYGQSQDIIVKIETTQKEVNPTELIDAELHYNNIQLSKSCFTIGKNSEITPMFDYHLCRMKLIENVRKALNLEKANKCEDNLKVCRPFLEEAANLIEQKIKEQEELLDQIELDEQESHPLSNSLQYLKNIQQDITGEISLAFLKIEWFNQWGQHYLPSLLMCHQKQTCNNFKDPGIKLYGGEQFKKIRQQTEDTFLQLPPPEPSIKHQEYHNYDQQQYQQQQQVQPSSQQQPPVQQNFSVYYDAGGGCFAPWSSVLLANGKRIRIDQLKKGDFVTSKNQFNQLDISKIKAIIKIKMDESKPIAIVNLNSELSLTPKHPIWQNNCWVKPFSLKKPVLQCIPMLFNIALEKDHQIQVGGQWCVTLGHQIQDKQAYHEYFATNKVIEDLKSLNGWNQGEIMIESNQFERNEAGSISKIIK